MSFRRCIQATDIFPNPKRFLHEKNATKQKIRFLFE